MPIARVLPIATWIAIATVGCSPTILKPTEADESRREVQRLEREAAQLTDRVAQLESELELARRSASTPVPDALPIPVRLELGRLSGPVRSDDRSASLVRLYLRPIDGWGRFVHPLGALTVELAAWPADGDPVSVGARRFSVSELAAAYRSGPTGTHYTIELPLDPPLAADATLVIRCVLEDDLTGRVTTFDRTMPAIGSVREMSAGRPHDRTANSSILRP